MAATATTTATTTTTTTTATTTSNLTFEEALDDVHTRFLLNLPPEELASADRIFFQIEQAWWFYEDMICDKMIMTSTTSTTTNDGEVATANTTTTASAAAGASAGCESTCATMPRFSSLKPFALQMFQYSPLLDETQFATMWTQFSEYKRKISTYGLILLNAEATQMVLCQTWTGATWTLPAGKINQGERGIDSAARECYEETGFDPHGQLGLTKEWPNKSWTLAEHALSYQEPNGKRRTYYVCVGVPLDFPFAPVARKEVSQVAWFDLKELPKKSFAILPIMGKLRQWIRNHLKKQQQKTKNKSTGRPKSAGRDKSNGRDNNKQNKGGGSSGSTGTNYRHGSSQGRRIQNTNDPLVDAGLADVGDISRWSEDDMFRTNEALLGRKVDYDGNPHVFAEQGFQGNDPHAFRVVGGGFMNSGEGLSLITKEQIQYQPRVNMGDSLPLTPFFTQDGVTPWGEVVAEAAGTAPPPTTTTTCNTSHATNPGEALLHMLQGGGTSDTRSSTTAVETTTIIARTTVTSSSSSPPIPSNEEDELDVLTDAQITKRSQARQKLQIQYEKDMAFIHQWVARLPNPINFRIPNVDNILQKHFGSS